MRPTDSSLKTCVVLFWVKGSLVMYFPVRFLGNSNLTVSDVAPIKVSLEPGLLALSLGSSSENGTSHGTRARDGMIYKATLWKVHFLPAGKEIKSKVLILIYGPNLLRAFKH